MQHKKAGVSARVMDQLPRVLFITNAPPHMETAGSIYFHRLLDDYPAERLRVITNTAFPDSGKRLACQYRLHRLRADRLHQTRFWKWRTAGRVLGGTNFLSTRCIDDFVMDFNPQVVVTLMQDSWYYELAAKFARQRKLPLGLFIHDLPHGFEPIATPLMKLQLRRDRTIYEQAAIRWCVSAGMERWYRENFGLSGDVLLPPRSGNPPYQTAARSGQLKSSHNFSLGYAGGLHYGYGEQIAKMIPALRKTKSRLELFCPQPSGSLSVLNEASDVLIFHGYAPTPELAWARLCANCDALLLPYLSPPGIYHLQYQTHFPSKLGDMLATGLPLLITGPEDASGLSWCRENGNVAMTCDGYSESNLAECINRLREDSALRVDLATRGQQSGLEAFDPERLKIKLKTSLLKLVSQTP
jgi:glycosyltransferase involved in cell wall biosynthesis